MPISVLVLCTGNSCRSIMAEAIFNHLGRGEIEAKSAGSQPTGAVHPRAIATLQRHGIEPQNPRSQSWDAFKGQAFDWVITVCDQAAAEACPLYLGPARKLHWSTPDPAKAVGTEAEINAAFEEAFSLLRLRIEEFLASGLEAKTSR